MDIKTNDSDAKKLFRYNRSIPTAEIYARIEDIEKPWLSGLIGALAATVTPVDSRVEWHGLLAGLLAADADSPSSRFLAEEATYEQFRCYVNEFAIDGLTEAQNFFPVIGRLPIKAQMAIMRVLIDEFGCGNLMQAHSYLYRKLLDELGLSGELDDFVDTVSDETLDFVNLFYWLAGRAPDVEYFLGALAYLEASIPNAFSYLGAACQRLGIGNGKYYTEHVHIDGFHMKEMQTAIREYEVVRGLDSTKVWIGALLVSRTLGTAVDAVVGKVRNENVTVR